MIIKLNLQRNIYEKNQINNIIYKMKNLQDYINEKLNESNEESKDFVFNFEGIENGEETVNSLNNREHVTIDGNKVTVTIKKDINIDTVQDILQQAIQVARKSQKSINDEQYAQKTAKLEKTLGSMNDYIDQVNNPEDNDKKENKEEE